MILTFVLGVLSVASLFLAGFAANISSQSDETFHWKRFALLSGVLFLLTLLSTALRVIPAGYVGVVTNFGRVEERTLPSGLQIVLPVVESVVEVDTRVQPHEFKDIDAASSEYQQVTASGKLNYHIDPKYAYVVYREVGLDFADKVIDPALNDYIKETMPQYSITEILPKREEIRAHAKDAMNANLLRYHIVVDDIYLANLGFSPEYEKAIEQKQVASQQVQTEQQVLSQKKIQAQQKVAEAQGDADAKVATAKGEAQANQLLTQSLSPELIQYIAVQKLSDKINIALLPSSNGLILDVNTLLKQQEQK